MPSFWNYRATGQKQECFQAENDLAIARVERFGYWADGVGCASLIKILGFFFGTFPLVMLRGFGYWAENEFIKILEFFSLVLFP